MVAATPSQQRQLSALQALDLRVADLQRQAAAPAERRAVEANAAQLRSVAQELTAAATRLRALNAVAGGAAAGDLAAVDAELTAARARGQELAARQRELERAAEQAASAASAAAQEALRRRQQLAADLPPPLLAEYERMRRRAGTAVAELTDGGACGGCGFRIAQRELEDAREAAATRMPRCLECDRLLLLR